MYCRCTCGTSCCMHHKATTNNSPSRGGKNIRRDALRGSGGWPAIQGLLSAVGDPQGEAAGG